MAHLAKVGFDGVQVGEELGRELLLAEEAEDSTDLGQVIREVGERETGGQVIPQPQDAFLHLGVRHGLNQIREGLALGKAPKPLLQGLPKREGGGRGVEGDGLHPALTHETEGEGLRTEGLEDISEAELLQGLGQRVSALPSDGGGEDPGLGEIAEDPTN